jgi:hypothetical protein
VFLSTGSTLELKFSGAADVIDSLVIDGVSQPMGTWGAIGSGAEHTSPLFAGTGLLQVITYVFAGDYNSNGFVDTADYVTWRNRVGMTTISNRDPENAGAIGTSDYSSWMADFGNQAPSAGESFSDSVAIPEPTGISTFALALASICLIGRRRRICWNQFP